MQFAKVCFVNEGMKPNEIVCCLGLDKGPSTRLLIKRHPEATRMQTPVDPGGDGKLGETNRNNGRKGRQEVCGSCGTTAALLAMCCWGRGKGGKGGDGVTGRKGGDVILAGL